MIELGLSRIARLVQHTPLKWRAVHVAGTNGKGSITAYISALLKEAGVRTGRFNSPHLIDRWDCICIQDQPVAKSVFSHVEEEVKRRNEKLDIRASEFEMLTATAFEIFNQTHVQIGVVEVGLGGRLDATNVLRPQDVLVSVISKVGLDHQSLLGYSLNAIASEKAGIMKEGVPCVVDGTSENAVLQVLLGHAETAKTTLSLVTPETTVNTIKLLNPFFRNLHMASHQQTNLLVAVEAFKAIELSLVRKTPLDELLKIIPSTTWPGRLQTIDLRPILGQEMAVLIDGAHNTQAANALSIYVEDVFRHQFESVTWILAATEGKNVTELVRCLVKPQDKVIATKFGPVDGMPWVKPVESAEIVRSAKQVSEGITVTQTESIEPALRILRESPKLGSVVIAGSLYLVSDVLRLLRATK
jgi:dihydrofolate synthase